MEEIKAEMLPISSLISRDNRIIVFIERMERIRIEEKKTVYDIVFDFTINSFSLENFIERTGLVFKDDRTMMEIQGVKFQKFGTPSEGSFYELPNYFVDDLEWLEVGENDEFGGDYLAYKATGPNRQIYFDNAQPYSDYSEEIEASKTSIFPEKLIETLESITDNAISVSVFNVGQGSWNSISFNNELVITYDLGSSSSNYIKSMFEIFRRKERIDKSIAITLGEIQNKPKNILIISHWDTDHYIGLKSLSDLELNAFDYCIVPSKIENITTKKIVDKLKVNSNIVPIKMSDQINGQKTDILSTIYDSKILKIYKGTKCRDRNKRGLVLSLHSNDKDFIFPADHHYNQIDKYMLIHCSNSSLSLVIPHHGGNAGDFGLMNNIINGENAIISSGGRYGHPLEEVETEIQSIFSIRHNTMYDSHFYKKMQ